MPDSLSIEHIFPLVRGGDGSLDNLALSCQRCNNFKFIHVESVDPLTNEAASLYNPRLDLWSEHFRWSDNGLEIIGLTPKGRASVERLQLNRESVVNLRSLLKLVNLHPPQLS